MKLNVPFHRLLRTDPPPTHPPTGHAAQRLTRTWSDVWLWCWRAHATVHIHYMDDLISGEHSVSAASGLLLQ